MARVGDLAMAGASILVGEPSEKGQEKKGQEQIENFQRITDFASKRFLQRQARLGITQEARVTVTVAALTHPPPRVLCCFA